MGAATFIERANTMQEGSAGTALKRSGGSQLDLPSLTLLSVAGWGRHQPRVTHWATAVPLLM